MLDYIFNRLKKYWLSVRQLDIKTIFRKFTITRKQKNFFWWMVWCTPTYIWCTFFNVPINQCLETDPFFFVYFTLAGLCFNIWNSKKTADYTFRKPLNFNMLHVKDFLLNLNSFLLELKKIFLFLKNVIFFKSLNVVREWFRFFSNKVVFWNPLFKKTSYFSFYKSFSSRFLK
jgi:hypothetical protein